MWCSTCQQDVPQLAGPSGAELRCGKCSAILRGSSDDAVREPATSADPVSCRYDSQQARPETTLRLPPLPDEDWALEAEVRSVQRLLSALKTRVDGNSEGRPSHFPPLFVVDVATEEQPPADEIGESTEAVETAPSRGNSAGWTILSLGLAVFACGAVLLTWSLVGQRADLWPIGLPLTIIGQAGLIVGVVLQLESFLGGADRPSPVATGRHRVHSGRDIARRAAA